MKIIGKGNIKSVTSWDMFSSFFAYPLKHFVELSLQAESFGFAQRSREQNSFSNILK